MIIFFTILLSLFMILLLIKNLVTLRNHNIIDEAIFNYRVNSIRKGEFVNYSVDYIDSEDYEKTFFRFWDWGYTRILPKEKYEIIKPFIKK